MMDNPSVVLTIFNRTLIDGLIKAFRQSLYFGLFWAPIVGLCLGIHEKEEVFSTIPQHPNQGIKCATRNGLTFFFLSTFLIVLMLMPKSLLWGLFPGLLIGVFIGLGKGLMTALQHLILRLILWHSKVSPWNYENFLAYAEHLRFVQRVGGRYRFTHEELRQWFAQELDLSRNKTRKS